MDAQPTGRLEAMRREISAQDNCETTGTGTLALADLGHLKMSLKMSPSATVGDVSSLS